MRAALMRRNAGALAALLLAARARTAKRACRYAQSDALPLPPCARAVQRRACAAGGHRARGVEAGAGLAGVGVTRGR